MSEKRNEFKEWMDARGLKTRDVAAALHVEEQTLRIWRSSGVPPRRLPHVEKFMAEWTGPSTSIPSNEDIEHFKSHSITLTPTEEQFDQWNRAALQERKIMRDWISEGLDRLAAEWQQEQADQQHQQEASGLPPHLSMVAEDPAPYGTKSSPSSSAGPA